MNTHPSQTAINAALASRGMMPISGACSCPACGDSELHRDDMATINGFTARRLQKLREHHGGPVCHGCADAALICDQCGDVADALSHCHAEDINVCEGCTAYAPDAYTARPVAL